MNSSKAPHDMDFVRLATTNEKRFLISDALGFSHCIILTAKFTCASVSLPADALEYMVTASLKYCVDIHPYLRIIVKYANSDKPQLALLDTVNLSDHLTYFKEPIVGNGEEEKIRNFHESLHTIRLPRAGERPQWSVFIKNASTNDSSSFYLAFMHSHALWDGLGTISFHETFLRGMNCGQSILNDASIHRHGASSLMLPIESAGKLTISWSYLLPILIRELCPKWLSSLCGIRDDDLSDVWTGAKARPTEKTRETDPPTAISVVLISESTLLRAIQACRIHGARLTALLNYLAARSVCKGLRARGMSYHQVKVANAIDLRKALGKGKSTLANYVSFATETFHFSETEGTAEAHGTIPIEDWGFMKQNTENLAAFSNTLADHPVALQKYIPDLKKWLQVQASTPPDVSFGLSNLGIYDGAAGADAPPLGKTIQGFWRAETAVVSQSGNKTGAPFDIQLLSTKNGGMGISATWWPGMLGVEDEGVFVQEVLDQIRSRMEVVC